MKKTFVLFGLLSLIILGIIIFQKKSIGFIPDWNGYRVTRYSLNGLNYKFAVADNGEKWGRGLMDVTKPLPVDGMIFIFPESSYRVFWNKNTRLDLDLYWLQGETVVGRSYLPQIDKSKTVFTVKSPEPVNKVVELIR